MQEHEIYSELKRLAQRLMANEPAGITLQPTSLVHEAWVRLGGNEQESWERRGHFFGAAAEAMRRVLIDAARSRKAQKRGSGQHPVTLVEAEDVAMTGGDDGRLLQLDVALNRLESAKPDVAQVVKLRYFAGLTIDETAQAVKVSPATVKRNWTFGITWMRNEIRKLEEAT